MTNENAKPPVNPVVRPVDAAVQPDGSGALGRVALAPCPFCPDGGHPDCQAEFAWVECLTCGASGPKTPPDGYEIPREQLTWPFKAIAWNCRGMATANTASRDDSATP